MILKGPKVLKGTCPNFLPIEQLIFTLTLLDLKLLLLQKCFLRKLSIKYSLQRLDRVQRIHRTPAVRIKYVSQLVYLHPRVSFAADPPVNIVYNNFYRINCLFHLSCPFSCKFISGIFQSLIMNNQ